MATTLMITKADFAAANFVKFSQNIPEDQINPHIYVAQEYDLAPRIGVQLYEDLESLAETPDPAKPELASFLNGPVKRYLLLISYARFISSHGLNVTQFGLSKTTDPQGTFEQSSAAERAVLIRQASSDASIALAKLTAVPFTFDGVSYAKADKGAKQSQSIRAPKRRRALFVSGFSYLDILK
jgi:hypothetical protein